MPIHSVCTTWLIRQHNFYLPDVLRGQWEFPDLLRIVLGSAADRQPTAVLVEDVNAGSALLQSLRQCSRLNLIGVKPRLEKYERAAQQSATFEAGRVHLPQEAPWLAGFERELLGFLNARHDDQVDSSVQFLQWAAQRAAIHSVAMVPPIIVSRPRERCWW